MNLIDNLLSLLNNNEISNMLSKLTKTFSNQQQSATQTDYYSLPTYNPEMPQPTPQNNFPQANNNGLNLESILKIAGILLQFVSNKKTQKQPIEEKVEVEVLPSKIEQYKRIE